MYIGGNEITSELYASFEDRRKNASRVSNVLADYKLHDVLYVNAVAWKSSTYKTHWPYNSSSIESSYFEAHVTKCRESGVNLKFAAFDLGRTTSYSCFWLTRFATRVLPEGAALISRESYEDHEAYRSLDAVEAEAESDTVDPEDEELDSDLDKKYTRKRTLRSSSTKWSKKRK